MILSLKMKFGKKFWSWALVKILKLKPLNLIFWFGHSWCPKQKSKITFSDQIFPQSVGKMVSETNFGHSKMGVSPPYVRKNAFFSKSSNGLIVTFWNLKVLGDVYPNKIKHPGNIFQVWMHFPAACVTNATFQAIVFVISSNIC